MTAADSKLPDPNKPLLDHQQIQHRLLLVEIKAAMQKHSFDLYLEQNHNCI